MKKSETINTFLEGLIMDLDPLIAPKNVLCNALNATLLTRNGNENVLQNDMGNGRVETAYLPEGYIPMGTAELGGIVYVVSYNPLIDKCLIGSFPSPERNITNDEISDKSDAFIDNKDFLTGNTINATVIKKELSDNILHPGDKFIVCAENLLENELNITDLTNNIRNVNLKLATIDSNGRIIYLTDLVRYKVGNSYYNIMDGDINSSENMDIDEYRKKVNSIYNLFTSKIAGSLYVVAELEVIDTFTVTWQLLDITDNKYRIRFDISTTSKNNVNVIKYLRLLKVEDSNASIDNYSEYYIHNETEKDTLELILTFTATNKDTIKLAFTPCMSFGILELLKTIIFIDFSLFSSKKVFQGTWRYFKEDTLMILSFNLSSYLPIIEKIQSIHQYFIPYSEVTDKSLFPDNATTLQIEEVLNKYFSYKIENRKSYSGSYNNKIPFTDNFEVDLLYLVVLAIKILNTSTQEEKYLISYRCMYTNGVYNALYLDYSVEDFDLLKLNLEYTLSNDNTINIKNINTIDKNPPLLSTDPINSIDGTSKTRIEGTITLSELPDIKDNYNTYKVDNSLVEVIRDKQVNKLTSESTLSNTGGENVNPDWVKVTLQTNIENILNDSIDESKKEDWYKADYSSKLLKITGEFYNNISASTTKKSIGIENYYKPVISTLQDLEKYGLDVVDNKFTLTGSYVGLGMANGGADNQGDADDSGGDILRHVAGLVTLGKASDGRMEQTSTIVKGGTAAGGDGGYTVFPNPEFSLYIKDSYGDKFIVPVLLVNVGHNSIWYNNLNHWYTEEGDRGKHDNRRIDWYSDKQPSSYRVFWFFLRTNNSTLVTYAPLNMFYKVFNLDLEDKNKLSIPTSIASLLSLLYVREYKPALEKDRYSVNQISFFEDLIAKININITYKLNASVCPIIFKDLLLTAISKNFTTCTGEVFPCLDSNLPNTDKLYLLEVIYKVEVLNSLLDSYLQAQGNNAVIESYVENLFTNQSVNITKDDDRVSLYLIDYNTNELIPLSYGFRGYKVSLAELPINSLKMTLDKTVPIPFDDLLHNYLIYDYREGSLLFKDSYYNKASSMLAKWECHEPQDREYTLFKSIKLILDKTLNNLNSQ